MIIKNFLSENTEMLYIQTLTKEIKKKEKKIQHRLQNPRNLKYKLKYNNLYRSKILNNKQEYQFKINQILQTKKYKRNNYNSININKKAKRKIIHL